MKEQDNIKDLFSKGLESHTTPVRPEVWSGLQAKMAAAGIASGSAAVAAKGISVLTKWIIGGAAATVVAVTTVVLINDTEKKTQKDKEQTIAFSPSGKDKTQEIIVNSVGAMPEDIGVPGGNTVTPNDKAAESAIVVRETNRVPSDRLVAPVNPASAVKAPENTIRENSGTPANPPVKAAEKQNPETKKPETTQKPDPVTEQKPEVISSSRSKIGEVPNVFTNGANNRFSVESEFVTDFSVTIMDGRGKAVFKSSDPEFVWDGTTASGEEVPAGSYTCIIIARGEKGEILKEYKPVQVIRH